MLALIICLRAFSMIFAMSAIVYFTIGTYQIAGLRVTALIWFVSLCVTIGIILWRMR